MLHVSRMSEQVSGTIGGCIASRRTVIYAPCLQPFQYRVALSARDILIGAQPCDPLPCAGVTSFACGRSALTRGWAWRNSVRKYGHLSADPLARFSQRPCLLGTPKPSLRHDTVLLPSGRTQRPLEIRHHLRHPKLEAVRRGACGRLLQDAALY